VTSGFLDDANGHPDIGKRIDEESPSRMRGSINPGISVEVREEANEGSAGKTYPRLRENERTVFKTSYRDLRSA